MQIHPVLHVLFQEPLASLIRPDTDTGMTLVLILIHAAGTVSVSKGGTALSRRSLDHMHPSCTPGQHLHP
jgi:hypothetical protein